jgi:hypothetical protein
LLSIIIPNLEYSTPCRKSFRSAEIELEKRIDSKGLNFDNGYVKNKRFLRFDLKFLKVGKLEEKGNMIGM